ncbi:hypothetical protein HCN44_011092 [Aphidius gifuensis]|uniref:Solute carrier family 35 member F5 n=1 Tax=Aphidius gifuensis TaxID=684658 RepID=A0A834XUN2_APHGI|nr:solute carrier family 35 member F5 [Aphidius gifuensis]KAF7993823.1 hypothetical protein HCN44_011092 [Aphidius gifuensis]
MMMMSCSVELRQRRQSGMTEDPHKLAAIMNKSQRMILGLLILLLVDIIWVSSSKLTQYIYKDATFDKPFFNTYVNTSMFTLYLLGLCFWSPWRERCTKPSSAYTFIDPNVDDDNFYTDTNTNLSDSTFVPIKKSDQYNNVSSNDTESDDSSINKSVRFSKVAEVRHMSESDATEALLARLSYQATIRADEYARKQAHKFTIKKIAKISFIYCLLLFLTNYTYELSLKTTDKYIVTILSSTSSLFTLLLTIFWPSNNGDKFTLTKLISIVTSICGLALIALANNENNNNSTTTTTSGIILSLTSAFFYSTYLVFIKKKVDHEDRMDIPMFFGFVGLFNILLFWPIFFILDYGHWEIFEWPNSHQWTYLIVMALVGTVFSQVLWLWGCFLTTSLITTLAFSMTMPMSMIADVLLKKIKYSLVFYLGLIPMIIAFITISLLSHYDNWDPVFDVFKNIYKKIFQKNSTTVTRIPDFEAEQTESLISINNSEDHEA